MHTNALLDTCSDLLGRILAFDHPSDTVVAQFFDERHDCGPRERDTLTTAVYHVLRHKRLFGHQAISGSGPKARRMAILGLASDDHFWAGVLTDVEKHWLDQCHQMKLIDLPDHCRHNLPDWMLPPLNSQLGDEFWSFADSLGGGAALDLRVNTLQAKPAAVMLELTSLGITAAFTPYSPVGLRVTGHPAITRSEAFLRGDFEIQDEGSQLLALLLGAKRDEVVMDFCAGAGGKTLALGAAMRNTGRLYAVDTSAGRLHLLGARRQRSGLTNVYAFAIADENDVRVRRLAGKVHRVLVDAPCSGTGTLRRHPDQKWRQSPEQVTHLALRQCAILHSASRLVKPGGRLVYATCSVLPQENEHVATDFAQTHPHFVPLDAADILSDLKIDQAALLCSGGDHGRRYVHLWPHRHQTDGFFAAVFQRQKAEKK